jgi:transcriptional regulator with XRE-family HTH domain
MQDPVKLHVSKVLRTKRLNAGLSLSDISDQTGISVQQLLAYENDSTGMSTEELQRIASALKIEFSEVFKGYNLPRAAKAAD